MAKKSEAPMEGDLSLLASIQTGFYASTTFFNDIPADWGVTIIEVACKFIDDDGNNDNKTANVNLGGNGANYTLNSTYKGCCRGYFGAVKVKDRGKVDVYPYAKSVEDGYCGGNLKWHLVPETQLKKGSFSERPLKLILKE